MNKKLSIIIPVFNEEKTIKEVVEKVLAQEINNLQKEIIVVDDGSTDKTLKELENFSDKILIVRHNKNLGKGMALRNGFLKSSGDAVIIQDADLEYNCNDWPMMLQELEKNKKLVAVYGSRELNNKRRGYFLCVVGVRLLTFLINILFHSKLTDVYTCYKLIRADFIKKIKLESNGFEIEAEITCKILKSGELIKEVPISYFPRSYKQGKHIKIKDEFMGIKTIFKYWLLN